MDILFIGFLYLNSYQIQKSSNILKYNSLDHHLFKTINIIDFVSMCMVK